MESKRVFSRLQCTVQPTKGLIAEVDCLPAYVPCYRTSRHDITEKTRLVAARLGIPVQFFIATAPDQNRKPNIGMWKILQALGNGDVQIDHQTSFFVGMTDV